MFVRRECLAFSLCIGLAACAPTGTGTYRDTTAPIGATTRFDAVSFSGAWDVVASFASAPNGVLSVDFSPTSGLLDLSGVPEVQGVYSQGVAGELLPRDGTQDALIVMWMDEDAETAAIGFVSGTYGALIDRDGVVPTDRAAAARDVFAFYGWNISALEGLEK